jgi:hypothetical protein
MKKLLLYGLLALASLPAALGQATSTKARAKPQAGSPGPAVPGAAPDLARTYAAAIGQNELRQHLTIIASDAFQGREAGQPGQKMAAAYLAGQFKALGLQGPVPNSDNPYLQHFQLNKGSWANGGYLQVNGRRYEWLRDIFSYGPMPSAYPTETVGQPVFVGFGIEQANYSDYAGLDVRGKDVIVVIGEPLDARGHNLLTGSRKSSVWESPMRKVIVAKQKGARSIFLISFASDVEFRKQAALIVPSLREPVFFLPEPTPEPIDTLREWAPEGIGVYVVGRDLGLAMAGTTLAGLTEYAYAIAQAGKPVPITFEAPLFSIYLPQPQEQLSTENVLGYIEGSDKKDEVLVISAHYDHLGMKHDTVYNGADDDGSGTVALLELAQAFAQAKKGGHGPRRSILFAAMTAEEEGLLGSQYYTGHPVFPLVSTIADLNIDMIGRGDKRHRGKKNFVYLVGSDKLSSDLHRISEAANAQYTQLGLDYRYNVPNEPEQIYYRSDHYSFAKHRIPVIFYTAGEHADYHKATDDIAKIEFDRLEQRARLVFHTAWELANREQRIVVDSNKP